MFASRSTTVKAGRAHWWPTVAAVRLACVAAVSALLQGCSASGWQPPTVLLATSGGATTLYQPAAAREASEVLPVPPPGLVPGQVARPDGTYAGTADPLVTDGGLCVRTLRIEGFQVVGDRVRFGRFHGRIDQSNGVQMPYGNEWLVGQFGDGTFHGYLMTYDVHSRPGCSFILSLERVAG
jgi:hypothetical protein